MTDTRDTIESYVEENPGVHFNELVRSLDLAVGQVQHHVYRLLNTGRLVEEDLYGRSHYYPDEYDAWERRALALLRRETARDIVIYLIHHDEVRPNDVTEDVGIARSTLEWHLDNLVEQDVVEKRRDDRNRVLLSVSRREDVARLLVEITPSLSERFVDRFMRLFDQVFEDG